MGYFKKFTKIRYKDEEVCNILSAVLPSRLNIDKSFIYQEYIIQDEETPESLAYTMYDNPQLYWVFLVVNGIINPYTDWPMSSEVFEEFVKKKYGEPTAIHHFYDNRLERVCDDVDEYKWRNIPVNQLPYYIIPKTNLEYEKEINEEKRKIIVINPKYVSHFVEVYNNAIKGH